MSQSVTIDAPFATAEQTANTLGVPRFRAKSLARLLDSRKKTKPIAKFNGKMRALKTKFAKSAFASRKRRTRGKGSKTAR